MVVTSSCADVDVGVGTIVVVNVVVGGDDVDADVIEGKVVVVVSAKLVIVSDATVVVIVVVVGSVVLLLFSLRIHFGGPPLYFQVLSFLHLVTLEPRSLYLLGSGQTNLHFCPMSCSAFTHDSGNAATPSESSNKGGHFAS